MLGHFATCLLTAAAFLGAHFHVLVVREFFALLGTLSTGFGASLANKRGKRTAARNDLRRCDAEVCTILARCQRDRVVFLAVSQEMAAMRGTHVARPLAVRTCLRT